MLFVPRIYLTNLADVGLARMLLQGIEVHLLDWHPVEMMATCDLNAGG